MSGLAGLGSLVVSLYSGVASGSAGGLLATLYGGVTPGAASPDPVAALRTAEANSKTDIARTATQPAIARDIAAFKAAVSSASTPEQLLKNPTALKVLLTANGLGDQVDYPALAQKALLSNTQQTTALANKLPNAAWKSAASLFDFANQGLAVLQKPGVLDTIANGYAEISWRQSLDQTTPGLSEALTFRSNASSFTTAVQILGDPTARAVVTTALGIPQQIAFQDLGAQEKAITSRLDITKLQSPKFVEALTTQYLIAAQLGAGGGGGSQSLIQLAASARGLVV